MASEGTRDRALAPNEYIHAMDETKGNVCQHVGATQVSLGGNDAPVIFDEETKVFRRVNLEQAIQLFKTAPEGWYVILKNPTMDMKFAAEGKTTAIPRMLVGHKVNIPGPVSFPLWPGQMAKVVKGHHLRYNQYLVCRVYDADAAKEHLSKAVIQSQTQKVGGTEDEAEKPTDAKPEPKALIDPNSLTVGKLLIIKGTEISFFIPPTGIEIVVDEDGQYVQNAVTLERLEYCILLSESGNKRYVRGPEVVFPEPTEQFLRRKRLAREDQGYGQFTRKFRAIELNEQMGIYIKVIADYVDELGEHKAGEELFLTGKNVRIYYPREEHAIMRYAGGQEVNYAVAIPAGEGRYLMDKPSSAISTVKGPKMLLPDPRTQVIVRRILTDLQCQLMYPGNNEALNWNRMLREQLLTQGDGDGMEQVLKASQYGYSTIGNAPEAEQLVGMTLAYGGEYPEGPAKSMLMSAAVPSGTMPPKDARKSTRVRAAGAPVTADDFERKDKYTPPRQLTLNTKFQGAVQVDVWTGYAVKIASKSGERRVVEGPQTILLDYDENLEVLKFSTGTPKNYDRVQSSVFLRVQSNRVSDGVVVETKDMVEVQVKCAYRINFEGDPDKWFGVENYVGFVTDHLRSLLRGAVKRLTIDEFYSQPIDVIRDTILGKSEGGERPGRYFEENGMRVYDVEVLEVAIRDREIAQLLETSQHESVKLMLGTIREERQLAALERHNEIQKKTLASDQDVWENQQEVTNLRKIEEAKMVMAEIARHGESVIARVQGQIEEIKLRETSLNIQYEEDHKRQLKDLEMEKSKLEMTLQTLEAETKAWTDKASAIQPELIAAMQNLGDKHLLERMADSMAPMAILGGKSIQEVLKGLIKGTKLDGLITNGQKAIETAAAGDKRFSS